MNITVLNTYAFPMGQGGVLREGRGGRWENLASFGAGACVIIAARTLTHPSALVLIHLNIGSPFINEVWEKIHQVCGRNPIDLYYASNSLAAPAQLPESGSTLRSHYQVAQFGYGARVANPWLADVLGWGIRNPLVHSTTVRKSTRLAVSVQTGDFSVNFNAQDVMTEVDGNGWMNGGLLSWTNVGMAGGGGGGRGGGRARSGSLGSR